MKTPHHSMLGMHRDGGNRSQSCRLALSLQTKLLVELPRIPDLIQLRVQENRQAVFSLLLMQLSAHLQLGCKPEKQRLRTCSQ
jgi:hypothetical protein